MASSAWNGCAETFVQSTQWCLIHCRAFLGPYILIFYWTTLRRNSVSSWWLANWAWLKINALRGCLADSSIGCSNCILSSNLLKRPRRWIVPSSIIDGDSRPKIVENILNVPWANDLKKSEKLCPLARRRCTSGDFPISSVMIGPFCFAAFRKQNAKRLINLR